MISCGDERGDSAGVVGPTGFEGATVAGVDVVGFVTAACVGV